MPRRGLPEARGAGNRLSAGNFAEIFRLVADDFAIHHVDHVFGNVGGQVRNAFQMARGPKVVDQLFYLVDILTDAVRCRQKELLPL